MDMYRDGEKWRGKGDREVQTLRYVRNVGVLRENAT